MFAVAQLVKKINAIYGTQTMFTRVPVAPNLSQMKPVHTFTPCLYKMQFSIILRSVPSSSKCFFPSGSSTFSSEIYEVHM
jgi:hypothetical protein